MTVYGNWMDFLRWQNVGPQRDHRTGLWFPYPGVSGHCDKTGFL